MKIYLACEADSHQQAALTKVGYKHRLLSYFYLRKKRRPNILKDIKEMDLLDHVEWPDEPIDEIPLDVKIICGGWWKNGKVQKNIRW